MTLTFQLILSAFNGIKNLSKDHFKNLQKLMLLNLRNNEIETIIEDTFDDLISLETLSLGMTLVAVKLFLLLMNYFHSGNNNIKEVSKRTFQKLKSLRKLFLDSNQITKIQSNLFRNSVKLEEISLCKKKTFL